MTSSRFDGARCETCPECGAAEVSSDSPRTTYACGSSTYDARPGTLDKKCIGRRVERFVLPFSISGNVARSTVQQGPYRPLRFSGNQRDGKLLLLQLRINGRKLLFDDRGVAWSTFIVPYQPELRLDVLRFQDVIELEFSGPPSRVDLLCRRPLDE